MSLALFAGSDRPGGAADEGRERRPRRDRKAGHGVPAFYGVVTVALVLAVVGLALSSPPPRTPPLAAVAPQVDEKVDVERLEQFSRFGEGAGGEGDCAPGDESCAGVGEALPVEAQPTPQVTSDPANLWPCVLGPGGPRQTEDPQSPPCIGERFTGDNGGATSTGVTPTEIRIGVKGPGDEFWDLEQGEDALAAWLRHFNRRYELYGRSFTLVPLDGSNTHADPSAQRAAAREAAAQELFAVLDYGALQSFQAELARLGVATFTTDFLMAEADVVRLHPHVWSLYPSREDSLAITGEVICTVLKGKPARHGGDEVRETRRRFGLIEEVPAGNGMRYPADELASRLRACGADHRVYSFNEDQDNVTTLLRRMQSDGITTISCVCEAAGKMNRFAVAEEIGYHPEWFFPGANDFALWVKSRNLGTENRARTQMAHVFGIGGGMRLVEAGTFNTNSYGIPSDQFWYHAAKSEDPAFDPQHDGRTYYDVYGQLLMLASGVQWAGPDLTPETFGAALAGLRYPNPGVGAPPWYQPSAGFGPGDHAFNSDFSLYWWQNPTEEEWQSKTGFGRMCYVGGGRRFRAGQVPPNADDLFFDLEAGCR